MNILYIDPFLGISGDMMISAFLDAGMPFEELNNLFKKNPRGYAAHKACEEDARIIAGIHLEIGASKTHLSIVQMEQLIESIDAEPSQEDAKGILSILVNARQKFMAWQEKRCTFMNSPYRYPYRCDFCCKRHALLWH